MLATARLYGILDLKYTPSERAADVVSRMLAGGVGILQLRAKNALDDEIVTLSREIAPLCRAAGVPYILNDHPLLVQDAGADGVHVGQDDVSVDQARAEAGAGALVGKSSHSIAQAVAARDEGADYLGFGPLFATPTKPDYAPIGLADIATVHGLVDRPIFCIGGIKRENLPTVVSAGARRVCVVSGILSATDPEAYARECLALLG